MHTLTLQIAAILMQLAATLVFVSAPMLAPALMLAATPMLASTHACLYSHACGHSTAMQKRRLNSDRSVASLSNVQGLKISLSEYKQKVATLACNKQKVAIRACIVESESSGNWPLDSSPE
jgi:hypothetical protein